MLPPDTPREDPLEPKKQIPAGIDVNWVADQIGWPIPCWVEDSLYKREFGQPGDDTGQLLTNMFNNCRAAIDKAMATPAADNDTIHFKYWRKLSEKATKMKPVALTASLYKHPQYDSIWMLVEYAP